MEIAVKDYKYMDKPSKDFNPQRNAEIIKQTFNEADKYHKSYQQQIFNDVRANVEAVASYGRYLLNGGTQKVEGYLGKSVYKALVGEKYLEKLRLLMNSDKLSKLREDKYTLHL